MPAADIVATRVVEIGAPPSAIWPWLVQMGPGRGGAYTYDWIERRLGIDIRNADRVIPELQHLKVGDEIPMPGYTMRVEQLIAEGVPAVPRLRQRLIRAPFGCGGPIWVDDPHFDIRRHVRTMACREPGEEPTLLEAALAVIAAPLPRTAPLWSAVLITVYRFKMS